MTPFCVIQSHQAKNPSLSTASFNYKVWQIVFFGDKSVNTMVHAVELFFNAKLEESVIYLQKRLDSENIKPSSKIDGSLPHISLAVFNDLSNEQIDLLKDLVKQFSKLMSSFQIDLAAVGSFPTKEGVVYLAPVVTEKMLGIHKQFHALLSKNSIMSNSYYLPGHWIPHCTVAYEISSSQVIQVFKICRENHTLKNGKISHIGFIEYSPAREICKFKI